MKEENMERVSRTRTVDRATSPSFRTDENSINNGGDDDEAIQSPIGDSDAFSYEIVAEISAERSGKSLFATVETPSTSSTRSSGGSHAGSGSDDGFPFLESADIRIDSNQCCCVM